LLGNPVPDGEEAIDRALRRGLGGHPPCHDDFVADIGVYLSAMGEDETL
jgi:hypothetical protein